MEHGPIGHQGATIDGTPGRRPRRLMRWAVPAGAVLTVGGVVAGLTAAGAQAAPTLPPRSAVQLLTDVATSAGPGPMTATVSETANLGLPALPGSDSPSSAYSLLSGTHTFSIWYADPAHVRISEPVQLGESDLRVNGHQVWLWDSKTQTATHVVPSAGAVPGPGGGATFAEPLKPGFMPHVYKVPGRVCMIRPVKGQAKPAEKCLKAPSSRAFFSSHPIKVKRLPGGQVRVTFPGGKTRTFTPPAPPKGWPPKPQAVQAPTPQQAARQILAALGPTTTVSVQSNVMVAGQAAYQISLAPKDHRSLISRVQVAIDAAKHFPLRLQVLARGSSAPAFQIGFTSLTFGRPAASNFSFTPPPGAKVKKAGVPTGPLAGPFGPAGMLGPRHGWSAYAPMTGGSFTNGGGFLNVAGPRVMGQGWLSVLAVPAPVSGGNTAAFVDGSTPVGRAMQQDGSLAAQSTGPASLGPLLRAATPVHGAWGSGHLLRTSLLNVLITSKGAVLVGAVQPSVLYADAAALK